MTRDFVRPTTVLLALAAAISVLLPGYDGRAQTAAGYPQSPVTIVVTSPAGGGVDGMTRTIAEGLAKKLKQPFIVSNQAGGTGIIGTNAVAKATPNGYTLLFAISQFFQAPFLTKDPSYRMADFVAVAQIADLPSAFAVSTNLKVKTLKEFVELARSRPGKLSYGITAGIGSSTHVYGEKFKAAAGIDLLGVPYRGDVPAIIDIRSGALDSLFGSVGNIAAQTDALVTVAVTGDKRSQRLPDVQTFDEQGVKLDGLIGMLACFAPAGTPAEIVETLRKAIDELLDEPEVQKKLIALGAEPFDRKRDFAAYVAQQAQKWETTLKSMNLTGR